MNMENLQDGQLLKRSTLLLMSAKIVLIYNIILILLLVLIKNYGVLIMMLIGSNV